MISEQRQKIYYIVKSFIYACFIEQMDTTMCDTFWRIIVTGISVL